METVRKKTSKRHRAEEAVPNNMISLLPNLARIPIESKAPNIPVILIMIGKMAYNLGKIPSIRSPE